jgi:hypothetical protein
MWQAFPSRLFTIVSPISLRFHCGIPRKNTLSEPNGRIFVAATRADGATEVRFRAVLFDAQHDASDLLPIDAIRASIERFVLVSTPAASRRDLHGRSKRGQAV